MIRVKKKYPHRCRHKGCRGSATKSGRSPYCARHRYRKWRDDHPLGCAFNNLKKRAKERGIDFSLTFEEYKEFAEKTDYAKMKGKTTLSLQVDRIENGLGYWPWNIQAITMRENARKSFVAYFNGGVLPKTSAMRMEYLNFEREYRTQIEKIAAAVSKMFEAGSPEFWTEFRRRKDKQFTAVTARVKNPNNLI